MIFHIYPVEISQIWMIILEFSYILSVLLYKGMDCI